MKRIFILVIGFLLITANLYAAGDLIVEGNVGIGTTTPATTLDVRGDITILADSDIRPSANSITAINIAQANGTNFVTFDTTNKKIGFFNSVSAIPSSTLGADMYLATTDVSASKQMFRAYLRQSGANVTGGRIFQTGNYNMDVYGASTNGLFYGMVGAAQINNSSANIQQLFGIKARAYGTAGHVNLGGGIFITDMNISASDWDEITGMYVDAFTKTTGTADVASGIHIKPQTIGTANYGIILDGDGAGSDIVFGTNQEARIYSDSGELFAKDGTGNVTQISPHDPETGEWIFYSKNVKTGKVVRVDMEKLVKAVEKITGEKFMVEAMEVKSEK